VGVNERRISAARRLSNGPNCFTLSGFRLSPSASTSAITARANEPMSAGNAVIYAALGLPPRGGDPPRFPDTPRALVGRGQPTERAAEPWSPREVGFRA
jgi:hypothetical protein